MQKNIDKTYEFAKKFHEQDHSGHDFDHIKRVYFNAQQILETEPTADSFIVLMAALLHDIDDRKMGTDGTVTKQFLRTLDLNEGVLRKILKTIDVISFSKSGSQPQFETLEQKIVSDADKLDAIGAMGLIRTLSFSHSINREIFNPLIFPEENLSPERYKDLKRPANTAINHFFDKLLKLKQALQTQSAKGLAQQRHDFMVAFLRQFFEENNCSDWQDYLTRYLKKNNL